MPKQKPSQTPDSFRPPNRIMADSKRRNRNVKNIERGFVTPLRVSDRKSEVVFQNKVHRFSRGCRVSRKRSLSSNRFRVKDFSDLPSWPSDLRHNCRCRTHKWADRGASRQTQPIRNQYVPLQYKFANHILTYIHNGDCLSVLVLDDGHSDLQDLLQGLVSMINQG